LPRLWKADTMRVCALWQVLLRGTRIGL